MRFKKKPVGSPEKAVQNTKKLSLQDHSSKTIIASPVEAQQDYPLYSLWF